MPINPENILPYNNIEQKDIQIEHMFDKIAKRYDRLNHILSLGFDRSWRKKCIEYFRPFAPRKILDIASGTGDLAILAGKRLNPEQVIAADLSNEMMNIGRRKAEQEALAGIITFDYQNCLSLTYPDNTFDAVMVAFGVRNFSDIRKGLKEMNRVLKPGGHAAILELSVPSYFPVKQLYYVYSNIMVTFMGGILGLEKAAYKYLPKSIKVMPQGQQMVDLLVEQGYSNVEVKKFTLGVCSIFTAVKI